MKNKCLGLRRLFRKVGDSNLQNCFLDVEQSVFVLAVIDSTLLLSLSQYVLNAKGRRYKTEMDAIVIVVCCSYCNSSKSMTTASDWYLVCVPKCS